LAKFWPNLRAHCRTVSWLTMMNAFTKLGEEAKSCL